MHLINKPDTEYTGQVSVHITPHRVTLLTLWRLLLPYGSSYKSSCARPDEADIYNFLQPGSDAQGWASESPDVKNYKWRLNPVWHRMIYSWTHMVTVGIKQNESQGMSLSHPQHTGNRLPVVVWRGRDWVNCEEGHTPVTLQTEV